MEKIYHYTKLKTALDHILPNMTLRTNSLDKMNDPKENQPWAFGGINIDYDKLFPKSYSESNHIDHMYKLGNEIKSSAQILCFVHNNDNEGFLNTLMWTHYAQNHTGVCLEMNMEKFIKENKMNVSEYKFKNVEYEDVRDCCLDFTNIDINKNYLKNIFANSHERLFLYKSNIWKNENEKRLVIFSKEQVYLKIKESLSGIYLGLCMPYQYRPAIDNLIRHNIKIYDLIWNHNKLIREERNKGDFRPHIIRKFNNNNL